MTLIHFTLANGRVHYVNPDHIVSIGREGDAGLEVTMVYLSDHRTLALNTQANLVAKRMEQEMAP